MIAGAALEVNGLCAGYGRSQVLFDIALKVPPTGAVAVLGRNGVGKTTLMKAIIGELPVTVGQLSFDGHDVTRLPTERRVRLGLGYVPQEFSIFARLSVRENLAVGNLPTGNRRGRNGAAVDEVVEIFPKLGQRFDQVAGTLSGGERKMLAIARALLLRPRVLLLDEPTEGVWIGVIEEIAERLHKLVETVAVVLVEQHLELALRISRYAYVLDRGRVALEGHVAAVRADPKLLQILAP